MAKELVIVFVYDCEMCRDEGDDPEGAIVYFSPAWVSRDQRHALCSQLMGVAQFFLGAFAMPKLVSLHSGKFALKKLGRYILCVGTDRNIPDVVLEMRSKTLYRLLRLFHYDVEAIQSTEDDTLSDRLAELFQVYLPILHFATNKFANVPVFRLPKSASNIFLEAVQILKSFQQVAGVLGGVVLYQNKVVATQLNYGLTKQLVVCDPYRIKLPADSVGTPFHLPVGVQLLSVFVEEAEVERLRRHNSSLEAAIRQVSAECKADANLSKQTTTGKPSKESSGAAICGMKRDVSRIFTVVEENEDAGGVGTVAASTDVPDVVRDAVKARHLARLGAVNPSSFVVPPLVADTRPAHTTDSIEPPTTNVTMRYYSLGLPRMDSDWCEEGCTPRPNSYYFNTICDPKYPLFRANGLPASQSLYQSRIRRHYHRLKSVDVTPKRNKPRPKSIQLMTTAEDTGHTGEKAVQKAKRQFSLPLNSHKDSGVSSEVMSQCGVPLTPLMAKLSILAQEENPFESTPSSTTPRIPGLTKTPSSARTPAFPKTPGTAKTPGGRRPPLWDSAPPGDNTSVKTPSSEGGVKDNGDVTETPLEDKSCDGEKMGGDTGGGSRLGDEGEEGEDDDKLVHQVLYVFGTNNTAILLLIDHAATQDPDRIHSLWERSLKCLSEFEVRLDKWLNSAGSGSGDSGGGSGGGDDYSYVVVDPAWGPLHRGGAYQPHQLELLTTLHHHITRRPALTEIIIRSDDTISYGYQCGETQVYYQQNWSFGSGVGAPAGGGATAGGLPTPADLMATVPLKARRRLERDHGIVLL